MRYGEPPTDPPQLSCDYCGATEKNSPFTEFLRDEPFCTLCAGEEE
jgi:hypothetical protein